MKKIIFTLIFMISILQPAQVLITNSTTNNIDLEPSAILEVRSNKKGILLPKVNIIRSPTTGISTDNTTIPTPVDGLLIQSSSHERFAFWLTNRWYKSFTLEDVAEITKITTNTVANQTSGTVVNIFPSNMPMFSIGDSSSGWTDLGVEKSVTITKPNNTISIISEGMASINNTSRTTAFQFAIGIVIDGKLKLVRKFYEPATGICSWKQFNISGIIEDLTVGSHTIKVMAYNLPRKSGRYNLITYGDTSNINICDNINATMAKTVLSATVTQ